MARWILRNSITRLSRCAGIRSASRVGRRCKDASSQRCRRVLRRGPGQDREEKLEIRRSSSGFLFSSVEFHVSHIECRISIFGFRLSIFHFLFSILARGEPASTEQEAGTERGKKNRPAVVARLVRTLSESGMQVQTRSGRNKAC